MEKSSVTDDSSGKSDSSFDLATLARVLPQKKNAINKYFTNYQKCRYQCGACGKIVPEHSLNRHHNNKHSSIPFTIDMYELYELNERAKCHLCPRVMDMEEMYKHQKNVHPHIFKDVTGNGAIQEDQNNSIFGHYFGSQFNLLDQPYQPYVDDSINYSIQSQLNYRQICVSDREFLRLNVQGRLYKQNGNVFLEDSI